MAIPLTDADLDRAEAAAQTLLAPLNYATLDAWRRDATRQLKALVGAEVYAFMLPGAGGPPLFCEETPEVTSDDYLEAAAAAFTKFDIVARLARMQVSTETSLMREERSAWERTPYVQEFLHPMRCFEHATLAFAPDGSAPSAGTMPHLHLHKSRPQERFNDEEVALLQLLYPAFEMGVETVRRVEVRREELLRTLDALGEGILLLDARGRLLHANRALADLGAADPEMPQVEDAMMRLGRAFWRESERVLTLPPEREVLTSAARYRLRVTLLSEDLMGRVPAVLVSADRLTTLLPSKEVLRERFGLTAQQARVALLMAEGLPDKTIADVLTISPHTARNHAKRVLAKLGVHVRAQVRPALVKR